MPSLLVHNASLVLPGGVIDQGWLLVEEGRITGVAATAGQPEPVLGPQTAVHVYVDEARQHETAGRVVHGGLRTEHRLGLIGRRGDTGDPRVLDQDPAPVDHPAG